MEKDKPKYAILQVVNYSTWWGRHKNNLNRIIHIETRSTEKPTGFLCDTLHFPSDMFCNVGADDRYVLKKEWEWSEITKSSGNCGSFSRYCTYTEDAIFKLTKHFENNGYIVIVNPDEELLIETEQEQKVNQYLSGGR